MRALLLLAALLGLQSISGSHAALLGLRGSSSSGSGGSSQQGHSGDGGGGTSSNLRQQPIEAADEEGRTQEEPKKYRLPGQQTRRERRCAPSEQEVCGQGQGYLVCEYNELKRTFATRCVRQPKTSLHLQLHPLNYCGTCRRCFEEADELRHAVAAYVANSTEHTEVAHNYGWPINKWCVSHITDFSDLFANRRKFRDPIGDWDVSQAVNMSGMFQAAFVFNQDLSKWNTDKVKDMSRMFDCAYEFNRPLDTWNTRRVKSMSRMFRVAKKFDQDLNGWKTKQVGDISHMFYRAHNFNKPLKWDTSSVHDMSLAFAFTRHFNDSSVVDWDVSKVKNMRGAFQNTGSFDQDLSSWDISSVTDISFMFYKALAFQEDDEKQRSIVTKWDLSKVQDKVNMFAFAWNSTAAQEGVMLTHPSYDGSKMTQSSALNLVANADGEQTSSRGGEEADN